MTTSRRPSVAFVARRPALVAFTFRASPVVGARRCERAPLVHLERKRSLI